MKNVKLSCLFYCLLIFFSLFFATATQAAPKGPFAPCTDQWQLTLNTSTGSYTAWTCLGQDGNRGSFNYREVDKPSGQICNGTASVTKIGSDRFSANSVAFCYGDTVYKETCSWSGTVFGQFNDTMSGHYECGNGYSEFTGGRSGGSSPFFGPTQSHS